MTNNSLTKNIDLTKVNFNDRNSVEELAGKIHEEMKKDGKTFAEVVGLDQKILEQCYCFAYTHYNSGQYQEALAIFEFLIKLSPNTYKFLLGAGACLYQTKDYETAKVLFCGASFIEPENPYPVYYIAECALKQNEKELATKVLNHAIDLSKDQEPYFKLGQRCILLRDNLLKHEG